MHKDLGAGSIRAYSQDHIANIAPQALGHVRDVLKPFRLLSVELPRDLCSQLSQHDLVGLEVVIKGPPRETGLFPHVLSGHAINTPRIEKRKCCGQDIGARPRTSCLGHRRATATRTTSQRFQSRSFNRPPTDGPGEPRLM